MANTDIVIIPPGRSLEEQWPLSPSKPGDERFSLTRDDLRALIDVVTNDASIADTQLPCFLGTLQRDQLIDRMLAERKAVA